MTYSRIVTNDAAEYDIFSLTIRKEMIFADAIHQKTAYDNLKRLQNENFNRIKIPEFTIKWDGDLVIYEAQFIKGKPVRSIHDFNLLYEDLVERDSEYSFIAYHEANFIKDWRGDIYAIDLDEYGKYPYEERKKRWENYYGFYAPLIEKYRGKYQIDAQVYGSGQRQRKIVDLLEGFFNCKVTSVPDDDYLVVIDSKEFYSFEETLDYLKSLYNEITLQLDVDARGAISKTKKATELFNSNNRTSTLK